MNVLSVIWCAAATAGLAGVLGILSIGLVFLVLAAGCLAPATQSAGSVA